MTILGLKITNIQMTIQICTRVTYEYLLWCSESKIWVLRFQMCDLRIFGLFVAFLVFMALKVKPTTLAEFSKPFDHIMAKKYKKNQFFAIWSLLWPSKFFFGLLALYFLKLIVLKIFRFEIYLNCFSFTSWSKTSHTSYCFWKFICFL